MFNKIKNLFRKKKVEEKTETVPLNSSNDNIFLIVSILSFIYTCNNCGFKISRQELDRTWDWAGPHCPNCGHTGIDMLSNVIEQESPNGI